MIRIALALTLIAAGALSAEARNTQGRFAGRSSLGNPPNAATVRARPDIDGARFKSSATFYTGVEIQRR